MALQLLVGEFFRCALLLYVWFPFVLLFDKKADLHTCLDTRHSRIVLPVVTLR